MTPQRDTLFQFSWPGNYRNQAKKAALSNRIRHVKTVLEQINLAIAKEYVAYKEIEYQSLTSGEEEQFESFYRETVRHQVCFKDDQTEDEVKTYLCDLVCIQHWLLVAKVMSQIQSHVASSKSPSSGWDGYRNRSQTILDFGARLVRCVEPIKADLSQDAEDVLFALRMKLDIIKAFHPVYRYPLTSADRQDPSASHRFIDLLSHFDETGPPSATVVEAYPAVYASLRPILNAATWLTVLICIAPLILAWQRSPPEAGSTNDADFWMGLQTLLMQLLNLVTMMLPVSRYSPDAAWRLAWAFAILAALFAVVTPILYVTVPVGWSLLTSYWASAAQAAVLVQIMLRVNVAGKKEA